MAPRIVRMLQINTNVNSRIHYDEWGSQFVMGMPRMFFRSRDTVRWQLYSETPGLDEDETPVSEWVKYTGFTGVTGINAYLTADNNYTHRMKGTLDEAVPTTPSIITATIPGAGFDLIPEYGTLNLFDKEGHFESLQYRGREIDGNTVVFQVDGSITLNRAYDAGWVMDAGEEVYMQATLDYHESDIPNGLFVFDITAYSEKLRQAIVYSDVESVPIRGLELAIFQVKDGGKQDLERFVVTTFKIMSGIAETGIDPVLPEEHRNEAALMVETLLASGFEVQYSVDGETWSDVQPDDPDMSSSTLENDDSSSEGEYPWEEAEGESDSSSVMDEESESIVPLPRYVYFRFRSAGVGGTWSSPIRIRNGVDGKDGIRGNRITTGTAITGRSEEPTPYPTGITISYVNDLYINEETQDVYQCVQEGDEETALWKYSFCLKGDAFDAIDEQTITLNDNGELQTVAVKEMNKNNIQQVWVGTLQEYTEQGVANTQMLAFITDDTEASGIDDELSDSSTNPVQNWVIKQAIDKKQDIARAKTSSFQTTLTLEPNKAYTWNLSTNGTIVFDGTGYAGKYIEIPVYLNLTGIPSISGVTVEGTPRTGYWKLIWNGSSAIFKEEGSGSAEVEIDDQLSDSSENPVQNKVVKAALDKKLDVELVVTTSTSTSLTVEKGKAYSWTPSGNATIAFNHTGLSGKRISIPIYLTLNNGRTVSGSTSSSTAVTISGTLETGECELLWNGNQAFFQRKGADGAAGVNSYTYIAYATNNSGSGFTLTPDSSHKYIAFKVTDTLIPSPSSSDFSGATWTKYIGEDGTYTYVAYASSNSGSGFSLTPSDSLKYRAEIHVSSAIPSPSSSDFSGATWVKYLGDNGTRGSRINYGTAITGTSTTPAAYPTGISDSLVNDLYLNTDLGNIYQCTTAGNASAARWVFSCTIRAQDESDSSLTGVSLNGEDIVPTDGIADVKALALVSTMPALADTLQDVVLYKGEDDATANPPLVKGHTYGREGEWSDSTITVKFGSNTQVLTKVGTSNVWNDTGAPGYETYQISHNGTNWVFDYSSFLYNSPACPATTMPWDDAISGATWTEQGDEGTLTVYVTRAYNGSWVDLSAQGGDGMEYLPVAKAMPTASATSEDIVFYGGEDATGVEKGHTYEKHVDYDDSTLGINWSGWTETLTKNQSGGWSNSLNTLSYSSSNGWWAFSNDYDSGQHSSQCANTVMPWDPSLTWYNNGGSIPITVIFTLAVPPTYSWKDISPKDSLVTKTTPTDQPFAIYGGDDSQSNTFKKGHLYENKMDDSVIHLRFTLNGTTQSLDLTKQSENYWSYGSGSSGSSLSYDGIEHAWYFNWGSGNSSWYSPVVEGTVMPWDSSVSGQTWNGTSSEYGNITIYIDNPEAWDDITPVGEVKLNGKKQAAVNGTVNVMALPIAIGSMPTADADAQPFVLFLGVSVDLSYQKGHLYEKNQTTSNTITVTIGNDSFTLTKNATNSWGNSDSMIGVSYNSTSGCWILDRGFQYYSPACPSTTMPWDPAVSGKTWNYQSYGSITPIFTDPTVYSWTDLGSMLSSS